MPATAAKPAKLNESLVSEYMAECEKLDAAKAAMKPLSDKVNQLYAQIDEAFGNTGKAKTKVGQWVLSWLTKKGSTPWKQELLKRISSDELATIEAAVPPKTEVDIQAA